MSEWISEQDRLPEEGELVLVYCCGSESVGIAVLKGVDKYGAGEWWMPEPQSIQYETISEWMPLPEPPDA